MAEGLKMLVDSEEVRANATAIEGKVEIMRDLMGKMKTYITSLEGVWSSQSSTDYAEKYESVHKNVDNSLVRLMEHVDKLNQIAANYESMESENVTTTGALDTSGIF
ncbi:MAG: WXG100 family type VII secretion target [Lachnospiraceae bacterium]|nr:WXG100 family type VII secretion target [Lachnospiraceae bacterium]